VPHAILLGEYDLTIDDKNRLLIPSEVRRSLNAADEGDYLYLVVGAPNRKPWLYPRNRYETLAGNIESDFTPDPEVLAFRQAFFANSTRLDWDKQGRVLISDKILQRTGTGREITMIGAADHLEIWNRDAWNSQFEENLSRMNELILKMKQQRKQQAQEQQ